MRLNDVADLTKKSQKLGYFPSVAEASKHVIDWFTTKGWKSKISKESPYSCKVISRKGKHHAKIEWYINKSSYPYGGPDRFRTNAALMAKTPNGGWETITWDTNLGKLITDSEKIEAPVLITKNSLPEPIKFDTLPLTRRSNKSIANNTCFSLLNIVEIVALEKDGTISTKEIFVPNERVWFHMRSYCHDGSYCAFITDGEDLYALNSKRGKNKPRVTSTIPSGLTGLTSLDKQMVVMAIEAYFEEEENQC